MLQEGLPKIKAGKSVLLRTYIALTSPLSLERCMYILCSCCASTRRSILWRASTTLPHVASRSPCNQQFSISVLHRSDFPPQSWRIWCNLSCLTPSWTPSSNQSAETPFSSCVRVLTFRVLPVNIIKSEHITLWVTLKRNTLLPDMTTETNASSFINAHNAPKITHACCAESRIRTQPTPLPVSSMHENETCKHPYWRVEPRREWERKVVSLSVRFVRVYFLVREQVSFFFIVIWRLERLGSRVESYRPAPPPYRAATPPIAAVLMCWHRLCCYLTIMMITVTVVFITATKYLIVNYK